MSWFDDDVPAPPAEYRSYNNEATYYPGQPPPRPPQYMYNQDTNQPNYPKTQPALFARWVSMYRSLYANYTGDEYREDRTNFLSRVFALVSIMYLVLVKGRSGASIVKDALPNLWNELRSYNTDIDLNPFADLIQKQMSGPQIRDLSILLENLVQNSSEFWTVLLFSLRSSCKKPDQLKKCFESLGNEHIASPRFFFLLCVATFPETLIRVKEAQVRYLNCFHEVIRVNPWITRLSSKDRFTLSSESEDDRNSSSILSLDSRINEFDIIQRDKILVRSILKLTSERFLLSLRLPPDHRSIRMGRLSVQVAMELPRWFWEGFMKYAEKLIPKIYFYGIQFAKFTLDDASWVKGGPYFITSLLGAFQDETKHKELDRLVFRLEISFYRKIKKTLAARSTSVALIFENFEKSTTPQSHMNLVRLVNDFKELVGSRSDEYERKFAQIFLDICKSEAIITSISHFVANYKKDFLTYTLRRFERIAGDNRNEETTRTMNKYIQLHGKSSNPLVPQQHVLQMLRLSTVVGNRIVTVADLVQKYSNQGARFVFESLLKTHYPKGADKVMMNSKYQQFASSSTLYNIALALKLARDSRVSGDDGFQDIQREKNFENQVWEEVLKAASKIADAVPSQQYEVPSAPSIATQENAYRRPPIEKIMKVQVPRLPIVEAIKPKPLLKLTHKPSSIQDMQSPLVYDRMQDCVEKYDLTEEAQNFLAGALSVFLKEAIAEMVCKSRHRTNSDSTAKSAGTTIATSVRLSEKLGKLQQELTLDDTDVHILFQALNGKKKVDIVKGKKNGEDPAKRKKEIEAEEKQRPGSIQKTSRSDKMTRFLQFKSELNNTKNHRDNTEHSILEPLLSQMKRHPTVVQIRDFDSLADHHSRLGRVLDFS